ncbi:MAG: hypothetical protein BM485_14745 [Desulfobulbaceae bacterium DB1]|nr:MAG: hypothetical protein BM485_14745 [Desulfobulbaceae bacterium DB1]
MKRLSAFFSCYAAISLFASIAHADCLQSNATGKWRIYSNYGGDWSRGTAVINSSGAVQAGVKFYDAYGDSITTKGGKLTVQSTCKITGYILFDGGYKVTITEAWMGKDKIYVNGVLKDSYGDLGTFSGTKY